MPAADNIVELRRLLTERFPHLRQGVAEAPPIATWATGTPALDALLEGGLPRGEFTELIGVGDGSGAAQVIHAALRQTAADGQFLALVDGADSFDASAVEPDVLAHLLWVRCAQADEALKATDLLLRDRNCPLLILDLKLNPPAQLRKISASAWYRYARLLEQNGTTALVITPFQFVSGAACRVRVESRLGLHTLAAPPAQALADLRFTLLRSAAATARQRNAAAG